MDAIYKRVSVRKFEDKPVEDEKILQILKAAMQAPSAANQQPWEFYVVRDKEVQQQLSELCEYSWPAAKAPVLIVNVCNPEGAPFPNVAPVDTAICTEHEWLELTDLGLGGVWLGVYPFPERVEKANKIMGLSGEKFVFSIVALGYPAKVKDQQDRFDKSRIHGL